MKIINILIISLLINGLSGQNLTVPETVSYINNKLKENPKGYNLNKIDLTSDGYFVIYNYRYYNNNRSNSDCQLTIKKFIIKNAQVSYQSTGLVYPEGTIGFFGMQTVMSGFGPCNSTNIRFSDDPYKLAYVEFSNDEIIHQSLFNAFTHLFELVKSDPNYSPQVDPNDPFAPGNYKKSTQTTKPIVETNRTSSNPKLPCNIQTVNRLDGTTIRSIKPDIVGVGNNCELGLGIHTNGQDFFLIAYVRYFNQAKKIIGNLRIKFSNDQSTELELYTSELVTMKNENLVTSIFILQESDISKLKNSGLKFVAFRESNNIDQVILVNQNYDIIKRQLNCFGK